MFLTTNLLMRPRKMRSPFFAMAFSIAWVTCFGIGVTASTDVHAQETTNSDDAASLFPRLSLEGLRDAGGGATAPSFDSVDAATATNDPTVFRDVDSAIQWTASFDPGKTEDGETTPPAIVFTAKPDPTFHVYKASVQGGDFSTSFVFTDKAKLKIGKPSTTTKLKSIVAYEGADPAYYHLGDVVWRLPVDPSDANDTITVQGGITYQACTDKSCLQPKAIEFKIPLNVNATAGTVEAEGAIKMVSAKFPAMADLAETTKWVDDVDGGDDAIDAVVSPEDPDAAATSNETLGASTSASSMISLLAFAFLGGIILNVMPCVLPVIGLKVMSFISQAGEDRKRVLTLNLAYVGGIFFVFAILASLATVFQLGWGDQFQDIRVRLAAIVGLFAFALSYLGVWEIPAPGMASNKTSQKWQNKEGLGGAFGKGVFATILATPCSAPLLGSVFSALLGAPPLTVFTVFFAIAAGMAFPYVIIGFFPKAAAMLPKPGPWMEKFKELMAFVMLGAVAFFFYQFADSDKLAVFITLLGVWFGCWIIGQVPAWDKPQKRLYALVGGIAVAVAIGLFGFYGIQGESELEWQDYSEVQLAQYQSNGRTVLVDFSAKWCVNCLVNLNTAIDTPEVAQLVADLDAVAVYADLTNPNPAISRKLTELQSKSIPLLAIYPGSDPNNPIILRDLVTKNAVLEALKKAGPSVDASLANRPENSTNSSNTLVGLQAP